MTSGWWFGQSPGQQTSSELMPEKAQLFQALNDERLVVRTKSGPADLLGINVRESAAFSGTQQCTVHLHQLRHLCRWFDVRIEAKEVLGIVLVFQFNQPLIVTSEGATLLVRITVNQMITV